MRATSQRQTPLPQSSLVLWVPEQLMVGLAHDEGNQPSQTLTWPPAGTRKTPACVRKLTKVSACCGFTIVCCVPISFSAPHRSLFQAHFWSVSSAPLHWSVMASHGLPDPHLSMSVLGTARGSAASVPRNGSHVSAPSRSSCLCVVPFLLAPLCPVISGTLSPSRLPLSSPWQMHLFAPSLKPLLHAFCLHRQGPFLPPLPPSPQSSPSAPQATLPH